MRALAVLAAAPLLSCSSLLGLDDAVCTPTCDGDELLSCVDGAANTAPCPDGCADEPEPHCLVLTPSNGASLEGLEDVDASLDVAEGREYFIDTDDGSIDDNTGGATLAVRGPSPAGGVVDGIRFTPISATLAVLAVDSLTVLPGGTLHGLGRRALIIVSRGDVYIEGDIDLSGGCPLDGVGFSARCGGPGGGHGGNAVEAAQGCAPGGAGGGASDVPAGDETGGGGGGFATAGGAGGGGSGDAPRPGGDGGDGGDEACGDETLEPLIGGSGGGAGGVGAFDGPGGEGGGGGGAIQIVSLTRIEVDAPESAPDRASIFVGGAGGRGTPEPTQGGGGGGAGGAILLEAPIVVIGERGVLAANGGGGGGGTAAAKHGSFALRSTNPAAGGAGSGTGNAVGRGGAGAAFDMAAASGSGGVDGGGGGGGGVGRIRINATSVTYDGSEITPRHSEGPLPLR